MLIDREAPEKYNNEYGVLVRRLTPLLQLTSTRKEAMGAAISVVAPGETVTEHVNKPSVEEVFLALDGDLEFTLEGEPDLLHRGDLGFAAVGQRHEFRNATDQTVRLLSVWWRVVEEPAA